MPRAAWQLSRLGWNTAWTMAHCIMPGSSHRAASPSRIVVTVLFQSAKRLARTHGTNPVVRTGAGRGGMGWKTLATLNAP